MNFFVSKKRIPLLFNKTTNKSFSFLDIFILLNYEKPHLLSEIETQTKRKFSRDYYYSLLGNVRYMIFPYTMALLTFPNLLLCKLLKSQTMSKAAWYITYCKTRYVSIFPLYVKAFGLSKIEQNGKEKLYLNIFWFWYHNKKSLQHKGIKVDRRQMKSSRTWT